VKYHQGKYKPQNPKKYVGNPSDIVFRSGLELRVMKKFDSSPNIIRWTSETIVVPYFDPVKGKARRYFPDFVITKVGPSGVEETVMVEVKPKSETRKPVHKPGKRRDRIIREETTWATNQAKWIAATDYCKRNGWTFQVIDEVHITGSKY
jgi:hypothetical protein